MPEDVRPVREEKRRPAALNPFREGVLRYSGVHFLLALLLLIVTGPLIDDFEYGILIESVLITLVLFSALLAIGGRRSTLILGSILLIPPLAGKWVNYFRPDLAPPDVFLGAGALFTGYVVLRLFGYILRAPRVNIEVLCTAVANYMMLALLWAFGYTLVAGVNPDAFVVTYGDATVGHVMKGVNSLYFSFATLCTVGYGDIVPVSKFARLLAVMESIVGMFYTTMLVARLVALYSAESKPSGTDETRDGDAVGIKEKDR